MDRRHADPTCNEKVLIAALAGIKTITQRKKHVKLVAGSLRRKGVCPAADYSVEDLNVFVVVIEYGDRPPEVEVIDEDIDVEEETTTTAATTAATEATTAATTAATEATTAATEATIEATTAAPAEAMADPAPATPDETENTAPVIETIPGESGVAEWQADGAE